MFLIFKKRFYEEQGLNFIISVIFCNVFFLMILI